jgi:hypothetical protein
MARQSTVLTVVGGLVAAGAVGLAAYVVAVRPWHLRWGATDDEVQRPMPGDELVPDPKVNATHAITIDAPAVAVWPWLVQWGYQRGGFYSYDWIDRTLGSEGVASVDRILPEHQHLEVGDPVLVAPDNGFTVATIWRPGSRWPSTIRCRRTISIAPGPGSWRSLTTRPRDLSSACASTITRVWQTRSCIGPLSSRAALSWSAR